MTTLRDTVADWIFSESDRFDLDDEGYDAADALIARIAPFINAQSTLSRDEIKGSYLNGRADAIEDCAKIADAMADEQQATNEKYPEHARAYDTWRHAVNIYREVAQKIRADAPLPPQDASAQSKPEPVGYVFPDYIYTHRRREYENNGVVMYARPQGTSSMPLYAEPPVPPQGGSAQSKPIDHDALLTAVELVLTTFKKDEAQGYRSRDRQFAIDIFETALSASPPPSVPPQERGAAPQKMEAVIGPNARSLIAASIATAVIGSKPPYAVVGLKYDPGKLDFIGTIEAMEDIVRVAKATSQNGATLPKQLRAAYLSAIKDWKSPPEVFGLLKGQAGVTGIGLVNSVLRDLVAEGLAEHHDGNNTFRALSQEAPAPQDSGGSEGHNEPCAFCGKPCSSYAGDPGEWPVGLCHPDGTGILRWHHHRCVTARVFHSQEVKATEGFPPTVDSRAEIMRLRGELAKANVVVEQFSHALDAAARPTSHIGRTLMPENNFPTVRDLREALTELIDRGLGDLAIQILVAPDSTLQALARNLDPERIGKPALMIDLTSGAEGRMPVAIISTERLSGGGRSVTTQ